MRGNASINLDMSETILLRPVQIVLKPTGKGNKPENQVPTPAAHTITSKVNIVIFTIIYRNISNGWDESSEAMP